MEMWLKGLHSICNMGTCGLPDRYTLEPWVYISGRPIVPMLQILNACLKPKGIHMRQITMHMLQMLCNTFIAVVTTLVG